MSDDVRDFLDGIVPSPPSEPFDAADLAGIRHRAKIVHEWGPVAEITAKEARGLPAAVAWDCLRLADEVERLRREFGR